MSNKLAVKFLLSRIQKEYLSLMSWNELLETSDIVKMYVNGRFVKKSQIRSPLLRSLIGELEAMPASRVEEILVPLSVSLNEQIVESNHASATITKDVLDFRKRMQQKRNGEG